MGATPAAGTTGAIYYTDPITGKACCGLCTKPMEVEYSKPQAQGFPHEIQIWCANPACSSRNMVGQVVMHNIPSTKHRRKSA